MAPVGLFFHDDLDRVWEQARLSALPTHIHPLGIEGASSSPSPWPYVYATRRSSGTRSSASCCGAVSPTTTASAWGGPPRPAPEEFASLGNGIKAPESVPTAIALFASAPDSYSEVIGRAILLGGDTDTIAAMAGASQR